MRLRSDIAGTPCANGCSLDEAGADGAGVSLDFLYVYDADVPTGYRTPGTDDILPAWQGFWFATLAPADGTGPEMLFPFAPESSTLSGRIITNEDEVDSVTVVASTPGSQTQQSSTNSDGTYELTLQANTDYRVSVQAQGFASQVKWVRTAGGDTRLPLDITLLPVDAVTSFQGNAGVDFFLPTNGAAVSVGPSAFEDIGGNPVDGEIQLNVTSVNVADPATRPGFPGEFAGLDNSGAPTPIISYGATEFSFTDEQGNPLDLAPGQTAEIIIPIYSPTDQAGNDLVVGQSIALWSLNERTGQWQQEGIGTVVPEPGSPTDLALSATVGHFSWWNCDVTMNSRQVRIGVNAQDGGTATISAVASGNLGWRPTTVDTTVPVNDFTRPLFVPSDREVCYSGTVTFPDATLATTDTVCRTLSSGGTGVVNITLTGPNAASTLGVVASASGADSTDPFILTGFRASPLRRLLLQPTSLESDVSYEIASGSLPTGLALMFVDTARAEIFGVVDATAAPGDYPLLIEATNMEETVSIPITIRISSELPLPRLPPTIDVIINANFEQNSFALNEENFGGPATTWTLIGPSLPVGLQFDTSTGLILIPFDLLFDRPAEFWSWSGTVQAQNDQGVDSAAFNLQVNCDFCGEIPIQLD